MIDTLNDFLASNPPVMSYQECLEIVDQAEHGEIVRAVVDVFFIRVDNKMYCVWLYGDTSTGKTEFLRCY